MPRRKGWKWSEQKRKEWRERLRADGRDGDRERSSVDSDGEGKATVRYESPSERGAGSPPREVAGSPPREVAGSPPREVAGSPPREVAGSPQRDVAGSPPREVAGSPPRVVASSPSVARSPSSVGAGSPSEARSPSSVGAGSPIVARSPFSVRAPPDKKKEQAKNDQESQFKQTIIDIHLIIEKVSSNLQTDFDTVFLEAFPDVAKDFQSRVNEEFYESVNKAFCTQNTIQNEELHKNVKAQHHFNSDTFETCLVDDVTCYQAVRSSEPLWNATDLVFGSFHQNDVRFSEQSKGYQCTCNALCMLSYALTHNVDNSSMIDKVLYEGDALYQTVISKLKTDGKFTNQLLSLEEIPDDFEVEIGKFMLQKFQIESGVLVDTQDHGLPTLHSTLQLAFSSVSCGLLTVGAICSAVFKNNGLYAFFDSHSHGQNGLSSSDGASCLITFSNFDDLVTYIYAFYDSMKLETDTNLQFDFLPVHINKYHEEQTYEDEMISRMEGYFKDQRFRQALKTQRNVSGKHTFESKKESLLKKRKQRNRTEYYKTFRQLARKNATYKKKEMELKQQARKDPVFKDTEIRYQRESKQHARKDPAFKRIEMESKRQARKYSVFKDTEIRYQKESKQHARKDPAFKRKEMESKRQARKDSVFKDTEIRYQKESKQYARKDPAFKRKEMESKQHARKDPAFKRKEKESKQNARKEPAFKRKEMESKQHARKDPAFKRKEMESRQEARKDPAFKRQEMESKQHARQDPVFRMKEIAYQKKSKQSARESPAFLEREKVYQNVSKQNGKIPLFWNVKESRSNR